MKFESKRKKIAFYAVMAFLIVFTILTTAHGILEITQDWHEPMESLLKFLFAILWIITLLVEVGMFFDCYYLFYNKTKTKSSSVMRIITLIISCVIIIPIGITMLEVIFPNVDVVSKLHYDPVNGFGIWLISLVLHIILRIVNFITNIILENKYYKQTKENIVK